LFEVFGKYILLEKIATGGMAEIWLAKQVGINGFEKLIVIKKILEHLSKNEKFTEMFIDEAKVASKLNHPNIVQIYDLGKTNDSFYIAMEYISGYDLIHVVKKAIKSGVTIPIPYIVKIISESATALYYANTFRDVNTEKLNIVHRDISPQNIILSNNGVSKIVDFGIAKASTTTITQGGGLKGKYSYMSPEQISGKKLDGRSDLFSLAIILYEITVGKRLFKSSSELKILEMITKDEIKAPIDIRPKFPKDLNDIIMKALKQNRSERYQNSKEFSTDLENYLINNNKNISRLEISNWLKNLFKEDINKRLISNKSLFHEADKFLEKENKESISTSESKNKLYFNDINEFEFDKKSNTDSLELGFNNTQKEKPIVSRENSIQKDEKKDKKSHKKLIISAISIFILYLIFFSLSTYYNMFSTSKEFEKSITDSSMFELPGKVLDDKVKIICNKNYIICDKKSIKILESKENLELSIKYKVNKNLFGFIPINIKYNKNYTRKINK